MAGVDNRQVKLSRGRFLGGSSGCNGTLCIRGNKQDYDDWGLDGWSGEEFFKYMRKVGSTGMIPRHAGIDTDTQLYTNNISSPRPSTQRHGSKPIEKATVTPDPFTQSRTIWLPSPIF